MLDQEDRQALYDRYNESEGLTDESTETDENATDASTETEDAVTTTETVESDGDTSTDEDETEVTDDPAAKEDYVESEDEKTDDAKTDEGATKDDGDKQKTVPHGLFHEEREKRKFLAKELDTVKSQLETVLQDYRKLVTDKEKEPDVEEFDEFGQKVAVDPKIKTLEREIQELRDWKKNYEDSQQTARKQATDKQHQENVKEVNNRLEKEGMPGFIFATDAVGSRIRAKVAEDPSNAWLWSPDGWYKVYKEEIYPEMAGLFTNQDKKDLFNKKKDLKSKQKIATKHGKKPAPESDAKSDDKWSFKDYMDFRKGRTFD